jgi:hypothetical protein
MRKLLETGDAHSAHRLAGAIALATAFMANGAGAVTLSPHGIGQALIYPYYTVNKNQDTLLSVTNASDVGKAIQVRFREGMNGRDALSFVLLLGAHDTWTAALSASADERARITTSDTTCTLPPFPPEGVNFRTDAFDGTGATPADGGPPNPQRTREGFFEMIVGGDVIAGSATDAAIETRPNLGAPPCTVDPHTFVDDLEDPTKSGIYGSASILDVGNGTYFAYNADALEGIADDVMFVQGNPYPGPELSDAMNNEGVAGTTRAYVTTGDGHGVAIDYHMGIDAVSAVFMADAIYNEYVISDVLGGKTDWVVTFPTKQFYVDSLYGSVPKAPFENAFENARADVSVGGSVFDREQLSIDYGGPCTIPPGCPPSSLAYEVNVVGFGFADDFTTPVLGSALDSMVLVAAGESGNASMRFSDSNAAHVLAGGIDPQHGEEIRLHGLPVAGFMVYNIVNADAEPGVLANYSGAFPHRRSVDCDGGTFGCPQHLDH